MWIYFLLSPTHLLKGISFVILIVLCICAGARTVVHPKARIIAEAGPIVIGEGNLIEEQALIINRLCLYYNVNTVSQPFSLKSSIFLCAVIQKTSCRTQKGLNQRQ